MISTACIRVVMITALLVTTSCASKIFTTTLVPAETVRGCIQGRFRIASISTLPSDEFFITGYTDSDYWSEKIKDSGRMGELAADLQEKACDLYPDIFTYDKTALPLYISVSSQSYKNTAAASSFIAAMSWGIFGLVLPLPLEFTCDYVVNVACPAANIIQKTSFDNQLSSWISFPSPLALIPIPKHADQRACVIYPYQSKYYTGKDFLLECFVEAIVQALYKADSSALRRAYLLWSLSSIETNGHSVSLEKE